MTPVINSWVEISGAFLRSSSFPTLAKRRPSSPKSMRMGCSRGIKDFPSLHISLLSNGSEKLRSTMSLLLCFCWFLLVLFVTVSLSLFFFLSVRARDSRNWIQVFRISSVVHSIWKKSQARDRYRLSLPMFWCGRLPKTSVILFNAGIMSWCAFLNRRNGRTGTTAAEVSITLAMQSAADGVSCRVRFSDRVELRDRNAWRNRLIRDILESPSLKLGQVGLQNVMEEKSVISLLQPLGQALETPNTLRIDGLS